MLTNAASIVDAVTAKRDEAHLRHRSSIKDFAREDRYLESRGHWVSLARLEAEHAAR